MAPRIQPISMSAAHIFIATRKDRADASILLLFMIGTTWRNKLKQGLQLSLYLEDLFGTRRIASPDSPSFPTYQLQSSQFSQRYIRFPFPTRGRKGDRLSVLFIVQTSIESIDFASLGESGPMSFHHKSRYTQKTLIDQTLSSSSRLLYFNVSIMNPNYLHLESIQYASQVPSDFRWQSITVVSRELAASGLPPSPDLAFEADALIPSVYSRCQASPYIRTDSRLYKRNNEIKVRKR